MTLRDIRLRPYRLPLRAAWRSAAGQLEARAGWLVTAVAGAQTGYGECAPWPALGTEDGGVAETALTRWARLLPGLVVDDALEIVAAETLPPCARFALETALLDIVAQRADQRLAAFLEPRAMATVKVNGMAGVLDAAAVARAGTAHAEGLTTIKFKVGLAPCTEEVAILRTLVERAPATLRLRLDANRAWDETEAARYIAALAGLPIDGLEEPLRRPEPDAWLRLQALAPFPLALDESLAGPAGRELALVARRLVLKPGVLGGLRRALEWTTQPGQECIVTTLVEGACAVLAAAHLAAAVDARHGPVCHGLATSAWLAADLGPPPSRQGAVLALPGASGLGFLDSAQSEPDGE